MAPRSSCFSARTYSPSSPEGRGTGRNSKGYGSRGSGQFREQTLEGKSRRVSLPPVQSNVPTEQKAKEKCGEQYSILKAGEPGV